MNTHLSNGSFVNELGLDITKPGDPVPENDGVPRIFLFREGKVSSLQEKQMAVGSREFWQAAAMGKVFAYRTGEKHPVQLQLRNLDDIRPKLEFSDPLDPDKLPQVKMHEPPGGYG